MATRNLLIEFKSANSFRVVVTDFGMCRAVHNTQGGQTKSNFGPVRWMAPESIKSRM